MTAIETLKKELSNVNKEQAKCLSDCGHVRTSHRYQYQLLVREARALWESIRYLESLGATEQ